MNAVGRRVDLALVVAGVMLQVLHAAPTVLVIIGLALDRPVPLVNGSGPAVLSLAILGPLLVGAGLGGIGAREIGRRRPGRMAALVAAGLVGSGAGLLGALLLGAIAGRGGFTFYAPLIRGPVLAVIASVPLLSEVAALLAVGGLASAVRGGAALAALHLARRSR